MPAKTHGMRNSPEYQAWSGAKTRCYNKTRKDFINYGQRGITVCQRWQNSFENFYADMGPRPSSTHTLERRNNQKGYNPENCYWAPRKTQSNNKRNNVRYTFQGRSLTIPEWARKLNIKRSTLAQRIHVYKWSIEKALTYRVRR